MWPMSAATPVRCCQLAIGIVGDGRERTGSKADIVESKLADSGVELEKEGQRLANATSSTENGDLGRLHRI